MCMENCRFLCRDFSYEPWKMQSRRGVVDAGSGKKRNIEMPRLLRHLLHGRSRVVDQSGPPPGAIETGHKRKHDLLHTAEVVRIGKVDDSAHQRWTPETG